MIMLFFPDLHLHKCVSDDVKLRDFSLFPPSLLTLYKCHFVSALSQ